MFFRFKKNRRPAPLAAAQTVTSSQPAGFGLFGVYVRSLPHFER